MSQAQADFAIVGSTPLARMLAGLLASVHGKRVVFMGESQAGYRLPRGFDLSVAPVTRPQTWALLKAGMPEARKLLSRIGGRGAWSRVNPIFFADTAAGNKALAHIRHMAMAFGHAVERVHPSAVGDKQDAILLRDAVLLHRPTLEIGFDRWLSENAVRRVAEGETLTIRRDGSAYLSAGDDQIEIGQTVLADDMAILDHVPMAQWPALLIQRVTTTIATEPTRPIAAPVMHQIDSGLTLVQQAGRGVAAMGPGALDPFSRALGPLLGRKGGYRQAGQSSYLAIHTADGAPAVGRLHGSGPDVLAAFGPYGAFLAPAIARWLCGTANAAENAWLGDRLVDRPSLAPSVVEWGCPA